MAAVDNCDIAIIVYPFLFIEALCTRKISAFEICVHNTPDDLGYYPNWLINGIHLNLLAFICTHYSFAHNIDSGDS